MNISGYYFIDLHMTFYHLTIYHCPFSGKCFAILSAYYGGGGAGINKNNLAYVKVQPVMELPLFTELQNLRYDENMVRQSLGVLLSPIQNIGW